MESVHGMVFRGDGSALRYTLYGSGTPMVLLNGMVCSTHYWPRFIEHFSATHRILVWDYSGHGASSNPVDPREISIEAFAEDCALVMDGAGIEKATVVGHSMGVQVMFELYRRYRERVNAMVALCGIYGHPFRSLVPFDGVEKAASALIRGLMPFSKPLWRSITPLLKTSLPLGIAYKVGANPRLCPREPLEELFSNVRNMDPRVALRIMASMCTYSAEPVLRTIKVPFLAIGGGRDLMTPPERTQEMADMIPGASYAILEDCSHLAQIEQPGSVHTLVETFLQEHGC